LNYQGGKICMKYSVILVLLACAALLTIPVTATTKSYSDVPLSGGSQSGNFPDVWDLTKGDMNVACTYDANGLVDDLGGDAAHAWPELGVRDMTTASNFNPNGKGVWLSADYDWTANTFDPDVTPNLDLDDKLILQKQSGVGEGGYNLPSAPPVPGNNHRFWWDRDGVDAFQNGETANTGGIYPVIINLHATSDSTGTAYMNIRTLNQGFETNGDWNTIELTPAGMTWAADMKNLQVFYGIWGYGATHSVAFKSCEVTGELKDASTPVPEFPSMFLPATMIIGFLGAVLLIQRTREH
jgi:hypothetical protein